MSHLRIAVLAAVFLVTTGCLSFHQGAIPGEPTEHSYTRLKEARVRYFDIGQGDPVIMIHGFGAALETWDFAAKELAKTHRVIGLDLKGFGWSGRPAGDYAPAAQARLVSQLMDQLGVESAALVAHSWGSSVALRFALDYPHRVTKIALYDAWVFEEQIPTTFAWSRAPVLGEVIFALFYKQMPEFRVAHGYYDQEYATPDLIDKVDAALDRPGTSAAALAAVRGQVFVEQQAEYPKIEVPTLLMWGAEDVVTPPHVGARLERALPKSKLILYPECGHFPMIEAAKASTADLAAFLSGALEVW